MLYLVKICIIQTLPQIKCCIICVNSFSYFFSHAIASFIQCLRQSILWGLKQSHKKSFHEFKLYTLTRTSHMWQKNVFFHRGIQTFNWITPVFLEWSQKMLRIVTGIHPWPVFWHSTSGWEGTSEDDHKSQLFVLRLIFLQALWLLMESSVASVLVSAQHPISLFLTAW